MKTTTLLFTTILLGLTVAQGQTTKTIRKVVPIQEKLTYALDGGLGSIIGKSRVYFEIDLPPNTVEWYYVFSSQKDAEGAQSAAMGINLVAQLTKAIDPTGTTATATSSILAPSGSRQCNIYVFPSVDDAKKFETKTDQSLFSDSWSYYKEQSCEAVADGKKKITDIEDGVYFIGIQNPSVNSPINVAIEVAAVVEEVQEQSEESQKALNYGNLGWKCFERGEYDKCVELSKKALELDNTMSFVHFNIGLVYLIKGQTVDAIDKYNDAIVINRKTINPKHALDGALQDIKDNMEKFSDKNTATDIKELIEKELVKYQE